MLIPFRDGESVTNSHSQRPRPSSTETPDFPSPSPNRRRRVDERLLHQAKQHRFAHYTRLRTTIRKAEWDDSAGIWRLEVEQGVARAASESVDRFSISCDFLVYSLDRRTDAHENDALFNVIGRDHVKLAQVWGSAYKSISPAGFPNCALLSACHLSSSEELRVVFEAQARYITHLAREVHTARTRGETLILTPDREILRFHHEQALARLPNAGKRDAEGSWPWTSTEYVELLSKVRWNDYDIAGTASTRVSRKGVEGVGARKRSTGVFRGLRDEVLVMTLLLLLGLWAAARMPAS